LEKANLLIYLDHNASTPVRPEVLAAMTAALGELHANPSSTHREGQRARAAVENAREQVAAIVGAQPAEIVFTSGGTEADHAALIGAAWALEARGKTVAISALEHHAVHGAAEVLARSGWTIEHLPATPSGIVDPAVVDRLPAGTTVLALMLANNETGAIQPVAEVASRARARGIRVVTDAVQAAGKISIDVGALGVDYLVISAHKLSGPKGVGALVLREGAPCEPLFRGSGHERGHRGGTENLAGIVGFGVAAASAASELASEPSRVRALRDDLERRILAAFPDTVVHASRVPRLPNTLNLSVPGARSDHLLMALDARGVAASAGAACASGAVEPSPVLAAMGVPRELSICALRLSAGRTTTAEDIATAADAFADAVRAARAVTSQAAASVGS
jgi:cysteine desulfurase